MSSACSQRIDSLILSTILFCSVSALTTNCISGVISSLSSTFGSCVFGESTLTAAPIGDGMAPIGDGMPSCGSRRIGESCVAGFGLAGDL